jgi:hypothetical protein
LIVAKGIPAVLAFNGALFPGAVANPLIAARPPIAAIERSEAETVRIVLGLVTE